MTVRTLIAPQIAVVTTPVAFGVIGAQVPATLFAEGLGSSETVGISVSADGGATFTAVGQDGAVVTLTATNTTLSIRSPGTYGVTKTETSAPAGVFLAVELNI